MNWNWIRLFKNEKFGCLSYGKIYKDEYDNEYIKLKNSWGKKDIPDLEVYLDGYWKENGDIMVRLHDPSQSMINSVIDSFASPESKSNCYYIDFEKTLSQTEKNLDLEKNPQSEIKSNQVSFRLSMPAKVW